MATSCTIAGHGAWNTIAHELLRPDNEEDRQISCDISCIGLPYRTIPSEALSFACWNQRLY
jgi:hypothetical protein